MSINDEVMQIEAMRQCSINDARIQACAMVGAIKVYRLSLTEGGTTFALIKEGERENEAYQALSECSRTGMEFVYRATPPQWN